MFRLVGDCYYRSVVCARRLLCAWKVRSYFYELCEIN